MEKGYSLSVMRYWENSEERLIECGKVGSKQLEKGVAVPMRHALSRH